MEYQENVSEKEIERRSHAADSTGQEGAAAIREPAEDVLMLIAQPLLTWYDENRRILPWREQPTPYHVWLSEIMLQQTRVEAVKSYYARFLERLPTIGELAAVEEETLLKLWEGLGYYNRARNLKKAAMQIMEAYGGTMPGDYGSLLQLAGIGSYTAGAIASIAFGQPEPAVDGNVLRILARLRADEREISEPRVRKSVEEAVRGVMPKDRPGDFNQALMELGAMVCLPNGAPKCGECPWAAFCRAHRQGRETQYPRKAPKKPRSIEEKTVLLIRYGELIALRRRPDKGLLAGLYEFPMLEGYCGEEQVIAHLRQSGVAPLWIRRLTDARHVFTHKEWHMMGYLIRIDDLSGMGEYVFVEPEKLRDQYPVPSAFAAYMEQICARDPKSAG